MSEFKVIEENKHGVLVEEKMSMCCNSCKYNKRLCSHIENLKCFGGRYLTEQEEKEYYLAKHE